MTENNSLVLNELTPLFGGPHTLTVRGGQIVVVHGQSGSGKSMLARAIADLDAHTGHIQLGAVHQQDVPAHQWRRLVGYMAPDSAWWGETVHDSLPQADWELAGLPPDSADLPVLQLSSGQKQRLALLRLLRGQPSALVLDEPTSHLDPANTLLLEGLVRRWAVSHQAPVLWISHDPEQQQRVADARYAVSGGHTA